MTPCILLRIVHSTLIYINDKLEYCLMINQLYHLKQLFIYIANTRYLCGLLDIHLIYLFLDEFTNILLCHGCPS